MEYKPHSYQAKAYDWIMEHPKCGLFLDMGMGKTVVTMTALKDLLILGEVTRILVIAPKRVAEDTWNREASKWSHLQDLKISKILGSAKLRRAAAQTEADIYIINRENVVWLIEEGLWNFDCCVVDELSSFKNSSSKRFKALKKVVTSCSRFIGLTGTPAPQGYLDLWSEIYLMDQGERLGRSISKYRDTYFRNVSRDISFGIYELLRGADRVINHKISDICMSMTADDYLDMPERIDNIITVKMSPSEKSLYEEMEKTQLLEFDETIASTPTAATLSQKLLQMANGFIYDELKTAQKIHERKIEALREIIDTNPNEPVMVFYNFKADLQELRKNFPSARVLDTTDDIADWNAGRIPILLAHPQSMGHGLNLQDGGHIIIWYGLTWSLEAYQQACARLQRQGQKSKTVIIHHLVTEDTVDEQVIQALRDKATSQSALINALKERKKRYV